MNSPAKKLRFYLCVALFIIGSRFLCGASADELSATRSHIALQAVPKSFLDKAVEIGVPPRSFSGGTLIFNLEIATRDSGTWPVIVVQKIGGATPSLSAYRVNLSANIYDLQASPDGQRVLLKSGTLDDVTDSLGLFLWDRRTKGNQVFVLQATPQRIYRPQTAWSRDGRYLCFYAGRVDLSSFSPTIRHDLMIYDVVNDQSRRLPRLSADSQLVWTRRNTLLAVGPYADKAHHDDEKASALGHTSLYEIALNGAKPQLLVQNAGNPKAESPDGKWIAFLGWMDSKKPEAATEKNQPKRPAGFEAIKETERFFCLYNRQERKKYFAKFVGDTQPDGFSLPGVSSLLWSADSKQVLIGAGPSFYLLNVATRELRPLVSFPFQAEAPAVSGNALSQYEPLGFTDDGAYAIVKCAPYSEAVIHAVNLRDGSVTMLARLQHARGVSWLNQKTMPPPALSTQASAAQNVLLKALSASTIVPSR